MRERSISILPLAFPRDRPAFSRPLLIAVSRVSIASAADAAAHQQIVSSPAIVPPTSAELRAIDPLGQPLCLPAIRAKHQERVHALVAPHERRHGAAQLVTRSPRGAPLAAGPDVGSIPGALDQPYLLEITGDRRLRRVDAPCWSRCRGAPPARRPGRWSMTSRIWAWRHCFITISGRARIIQPI